MSSKLTVAALKEALAAAGLDTKGLKSVLVERLDAYRSAQGENSAGPAPEQQPSVTDAQPPAAAVQPPAPAAPPPAPAG